ncbi:MAG: VTT domain-containing protein [Candidatus Roizmanbacteria bacterium]|nr:VTT domain-containing protein [Candidatus Roizmanbacteria bacterium]
MQIISQIPLELIVFFGSIIEEIIPPLPSPLLLIITKIATYNQKFSVPYILLLTSIAVFGKTIGSLFLYFLGDKTEDLIIGRFGKLFKISGKDIENIGKRFTGSWKDFIVLIFLRAIPIIPTTPVSLVCGIIKLNIRTFLISTFIGSLIRIFFLLYLGVAMYQSLTTNIESTLIILLVFIIICFAGWFYYKRKGSSH